MKVVAIVSGGLDSVTLLHWFVASSSPGEEVMALSMLYGQRHAREVDCAERAAHRLGVRHWKQGLPGLGLLRSALTDPTIEVPEGHYAHESMKATIVPNRNMLMLAMAAAVATSEGFTAVAYGAHAGDHAIYPDCRPEFYAAMGDALRWATEPPVELIAPFISKTKAEIVSIGHYLGVPFADTWSCYKGGTWHCGKCGTCVERREAFEIAGVEDPTVYAPEAMQP